MSDNTKQIHALVVLRHNNQSTSDFFLPHQQPPVEQFLKSLGNNDDQFSIPTDLPDIAFMRRLSIQGRMRYFQGQVSGAGDIVSFTPANGETFFFLTASVNAETVSADIEVLNDGMSRWLQNVHSAVVNLYSINIGIDSLVGDGSKAYSITSDGFGGALTNASMIGWVENTSRIRDVTT